jgi:A/G-specific adenine glycosylase
MKAENRVVRDLLLWYRAHGRHELPWRQTRDPYKVLVSELMLQQTQVPRVIPKYNAFLQQFPTMKKLAAAARKDVLAAWQGLGYNARAIRLHELAKQVCGRGLPATYDELLALPGIGPYTAGAIVIFAHNQAAPSVDVNVRRVLTRLFYDDNPDAKALERKAEELLQASRAPHDWHSALMDFGSAICTAKAPKCDACPLFAACVNKGPRADELTARKQAAPFVGSTRWWRGQIIKSLLKESMEKKDLLNHIRRANKTTRQEENFDKALEGLAAENVVQRIGNRWELK